MSWALPLVYATYQQIRSLGLLYLFKLAQVALVGTQWPFGPLVV